MVKKRALIIGGGISGLAAGYLLSKKNYQVTVIEKEKEPGGLLGSFEMHGTKIEKTYHHIFTTDKDILWLIKDLGLSEKLVWKDNSIGLWWKKQMYPFNGPMDLMKFSPLSFVDKIRSGLVGLWLMIDNNYEKYEKIKAINWLKKWNGENATKIIWQPLLEGKFHNFSDSISMVWMWARIHTRGNSKQLGYLNGGFGQIVERLVEEIEKNNVGTGQRPVQMNKGTAQCVMNKGTAQCVMNKGTAQCAVRTAVEVQSKDFEDLKENYDLVIDTRPEEGIDYLGAITMVFSTKQSLSPYYWHNINDTSAPFLAFIQHTNLIDKKEYGGNNVYYLGKYLPQNHEYIKMSDKELEKIFFDYLKTIYPDFKPEKTKITKIFKFKHAQHVVDVKYRNKIPAYKIDEKNYKLNFSQIYPEDRGINFAVKEARKLVEMINHSK